MYAPAAPQKNDHVNNSGVCIKRCTTMFSDDKKINRSGQGHFWSICAHRSISHTMPPKFCMQCLEQVQHFSIVTKFLPTKNSLTYSKWEYLNNLQFPPTRVCWTGPATESISKRNIEDLQPPKKTLLCNTRQRTKQERPAGGTTQLQKSDLLHLCKEKLWISTSSIPIHQIDKQEVRLIPKLYP